MRIPQQDRPPGSHRRTYEEDLSLRYLSPGAFTVLPPDRDRHDPPTAPQPYRLTPTTARRRREQAFSIIAETNSNPGSRSPSPSGRVSPFRGRGFNPVGSRHASPAPSPPPGGHRNALPTSNSKTSPRRSQIPKLARRGSATLFGESVTHEPVPNNLSPKLSKSLTNIAPTKKVHYKPPHSPRGKAPAFQKLSPIAGSSPEPSNEQKKSSKIPRGQNASPARRNVQKSSITTTPRNSSRDPSPGKIPTTSPTRTPRNYKKVQAKVNSYNKLKPKVPPKPNTNNEKSADKTKPGGKSEKPQLVRKESEKMLLNKNAPTPGILKTESSYKNTGSNSNLTKTTSNTTINSNTDAQKRPENEPKSTAKKVIEDINAKNTTTGLKQSESSSKLSDLPGTTTVVSSTTSTATKPLKIETNMEDRVKNTTTGEKIAPMVDGRILSATSVSNAMNKMNDTVLNSQTLIKDHSFSKLSPAASAIVSLSNEEYKQKTLESKNLRNASDKFQHKQSSDSLKTISNAVSHGTANHKPSLGSGMNSLEKIGGQNLMDARRVIAADVKPLRITVKEKPPVDVQSGNMRYAGATANGISEMPPGLPPPRPPENPQHHEDPPKPTPYNRFLDSCRRKLHCGCCKTTPSSDKKSMEKKQDAKTTTTTNTTTSCFTCSKTNNENDEERMGIAMEDTEKKTCWERLRCCGGNKVGDKTTGCCPRGKRKDSWVNRRDASILSSAPPPTPCCSKQGCKDFFRRIFCCCYCCKKKVVEDPISRRESMLSKKKSLSSTVPPPEPKPKLDLSLVEHASHMKAAIPVLPVKLAWFCLICNIFLPGVGTLLSGLFCLCIGIPRFSQKDGPKPRIGAFIIDFFIACGQLFTVLFCLVGWGWSIWWGLIMLKIAKKHQKLMAQETQEGGVRVVIHNHHQRDVERGAT